MVRCNGCSLVYRNPRPTASDIREAHAGNQTSLELEERVGNRRRHQFGRFLDSLPERPGRLLDIGCGYGFFLKIADEKSWKAVGVDLNPNGIAYAKERLGVNAVLGDFRDVRFPDGSFDLVTLWNVLDHTPDPLELLLEVHRVLKEDGRVFIRTPNAVWQYLNFRVANFLRHLGWGKVFDERPFATFVFHMTSFSRSTIRFLIEHAGFVPLGIENSKPTRGDPYLGLGSGGELLLTLIKLIVHGLAQSAYLASGGRFVIGSSLDAWGRRSQIQEVLVRVQRETAEGEESGESVDAA